MKLTLRIALFLFLMCAISGCETDTVTGIQYGNLTVIVMDADSLLFAGTEVRLITDKASRAVTDSSGRCAFVDVPTHLTHVFISEEGFRKAHCVFWMSPEDVTRTILLAPIETHCESFEGESVPTDWVTYGDEPWVVDADTSYTGGACLRSGAIDTSEESVLEYTVEVNWPAEMSFWYRADLDYYDHYFRFYLDGESLIQESDDHDWTEFRMELDIGTHTLRWIFSKPYGGPQETAVWLDDFCITQ